MSNAFPALITFGGLVMLAIGSMLCIFGVVSVGPYLALAVVSILLMVFGIALNGAMRK